MPHGALKRVAVLAIVGSCYWMGDYLRSNQVNNTRYQIRNDNYSPVELARYF